MGRMLPGTITGFLPPGLIVVAIDGETRMGPQPFLPGDVRFLSDPPKERTWKDASGSFEITATQKSGVFPFQLSTARIRQQWDAFDKSTLVKLDPGPVAIQMQQLPFSPAEQQEIRAALAKQLQENGFTVQETAPLTLILQVQVGKTETAEVREFGESPFSAADATVTYTPTTSQIRLVRGETLLWKELSANSPVGSFHVKENESCQQAVDRICRPNTAFFTMVQLPAPGLLLPDSKRQLGAWKLTGSGLQ